jgi:hypothetical protein
MAQIPPEVLSLEGIPLIKAILEWEQFRFLESNFSKGSTYEEINEDFGLFPKHNVFPVYFAGDIARPNEKKIIVGINPGYSKARNIEEQKFLRQMGLFDGYCKIFSDYFAIREKGLIPYYANVAGFLKRFYGLKEEITWHWLQENLINLEMVPYHSVSSNGLRINDPVKYRDTHFEILLRIIRYLNPTQPIFFNGFPPFADILKEFSDVIEFENHENIWIGSIDHRYQFVGLPFLTRVSGGKDALVDCVKNYLGKVQ